MIQVRWASMKDPVVHVDDLKAWLRDHIKPDDGAAWTMIANATIGELLREIEDAEKEG